jgi:hypothetical protein
LEKFVGALSLPIGLVMLESISVITIPRIGLAVKAKFTLELNLAAPDIGALLSI